MFTLDNTVGRSQAECGALNEAFAARLDKAGVERGTEEAAAIEEDFLREVTRGGIPASAEALAA